MMYGAGKGVNWASIILEILKVLLDLTDMEFSITGITRGSDGKDSACSAGDLGLSPRLGRSPGEGTGNPLQYSCLENSWTEKPGGLQSMGSQSQTRLSDQKFYIFQREQLISNQMG